VVVGGIHPEHLDVAQEGATIIVVDTQNGDNGPVVAVQPQRLNQQDYPLSKRV